MSIDELYMWVAYSANEPWGDDRADWHNAQTSYLMASMWGSGKKHKITDFLLKFGKKRDKIRPEGSVDKNKWNALVLQAMFGNAKKGNV